MAKISPLEVQILEIYFFYVFLETVFAIFPQILDPIIKTVFFCFLFNLSQMAKH